MLRRCRVALMLLVVFSPKVTLADLGQDIIQLVFPRFDDPDAMIDFLNINVEAAQTSSNVVDLKYLENDDDIPTLIALAQKGSPEESRQAITQLKDIGSIASANALADMARYEGLRESARARRALSDMSTSLAGPRLVALIKDPSVSLSVKRTVIGLLQKHSSQEIEAELLLQVDNPETCKYAISTLGKIGSSNVIYYLQTYLSDEYTTDIKLHAQHAISLIQMRESGNYQPAVELKPAYKEETNSVIAESHNRETVKTPSKAQLDEIEELRAQLIEIGQRIQTVQSRAYKTPDMQIAIAHLSPTLAAEARALDPQIDSRLNKIDPNQRREQVRVAAVKVMANAKIQKLVNETIGMLVQEIFKLQTGIEDEFRRYSDLMAKYSTLMTGVSKSNYVSPSLPLSVPRTAE